MIASLPPESMNMSLYTDGINPEPPWYVIHAKPQQELLAAAVIQANLGLSTWVPEVKQQQHGRRQLGPLFPGYLFVQAAKMGLPTSSINSSPGVLRVIAFGPEPQPLPAPVVAKLREAVDGVNAQGGLPRHPFHPGNTVRFRSGPMEGLEAIFVGPLEPAARVEVLLRFLGSQRTLYVAPGELELVANPIAERPQGRRSRGTGRPIRLETVGATPPLPR